MIRRVALLAVLTTSVLVPSVVQARGYRGSTIVTPYGTANMNSPEWKMAGGNIYVYQQIMEEKMMMQQQQMMMKQQQQYMQQMQKMQKMQKSGQLNGFNVPQNNSPFSNVNSLSPRTGKKKRRTTTASKSATTKAKTATETSATTPDDSTSAKTKAKTATTTKTTTAKADDENE